jgi:hypothetical protein
MPKNMWKVKPVTMNLQLRYSGCRERNAARVVDCTAEAGAEERAGPARMHLAAQAP